VGSRVSGSDGEEKNSRHFSRRELNPGSPTRSLVSILTWMAKILIIFD